MSFPIFQLHATVNGASDITGPATIGTMAHSEAITFQAEEFNGVSPTPMAIQSISFNSTDTFNNLNLIGGATEHTALTEQLDLAIPLPFVDLSSWY
jgi:hypothetical protein